MLRLEERHLVAVVQLAYTAKVERARQPLSEHALMPRHTNDSIHRW